jgi:hypothetical protein
MPLQEYIDKYYGGNKSAFARAMGSAVMCRHAG